MRRKARSLILIYLIAILTGVALAFLKYPRPPSPEPQAVASGISRVDKPIVNNRREKIVIKGLHVSGWVAGSDDLFKGIVRMAKETEINALVIDCKDETGHVSWKSRVSLARKSRADSENRIKDIRSIIKICENYSIYPITRIVVFRDPVMAKFKPALAVHDKSGGIWKTRKGYPFLDPYNKEVWKYNIALAREAYALGFKEIQFDYVRFPTDGDTSRCVYPAQDSRTKDEAIEGFLKYAKEELAPLGAVIAIDVFGQTAMGDGNMGIGQRIEKIANFVDVISPMLYPSHYRKGVYGAQNPEASPYLIIDKSLKDFRAKLEGRTCTIRPWLQDFSLSHRYGEREVRAQIKACYDNGIEGWMLWDPRCRFTLSALEDASF